MPDDKTVLGRDAILTAREKHGPRTERVDVPELGGVVLVRSLTGKELDEITRWRRSVEDPKTGDFDIAEHAVRIAIYACVDEAGHQLFRDEDRVALLAQVDGAALTRIVGAASRLNNPSARQIETIAKN